MATSRQCPACDAPVAEDARRCARCGTPLGLAPKPARGACRMCVVAAVVSVLVLLMWVAVLLLEVAGF